MTLIKKSTVPSLLSDRWLTDFFDNRFFDSDWMKMTANPALPAVNILETEKEFTVELAAPGMTKKDFEIVVENGILTISAEKKIEQEVKEENYTRREFNYSNFSRSFTLPENVNDEKIMANYEEGLLKLHLMKKVTEKPLLKKEIKVS